FALLFLTSTLFPYTTLFRSPRGHLVSGRRPLAVRTAGPPPGASGGGWRGARRGMDRAVRQGLRRHALDVYHGGDAGSPAGRTAPDRKSTRLNSSHGSISYAV